MNNSRYRKPCAENTYSPNVLEKLSEESQRRSQRSPIGSRKVPFGPFRAPYSGQIHAWSVAQSPFRTVSRRISMKMSSRRAALKRGSVTQHRPEDVDPPPR